MPPEDHFLRKNWVGKTILCIAQPFSEKELFDEEDVSWLRQQTAQWNKALCQNYLPEGASRYLSF